MPSLHLSQLKLPRIRRRWQGSGPWREWCFWRVVGRKFRIRFLFLGIVLLGGAFAFRWAEPDKHQTLLKGVYCTWSLIFGEQPQEYPEHSPLLQAMFFIIPVLGLVGIIEAIVEFSLLVRDRRRAERSWCVMMAQSMKNHIVIVGLGRLGYRTFKLLHALGEPIVVIECDEKCQFLDEVRRAGAPLILDDARRDQVLIDANIRSARSIVISTNDDLANLEIALDARRMQPKIRVVLRMFDQAMADKIRDGFNIRISMSQAALAAPAFAMAAIDPSIVNSFVVGDQLVTMLRWTVRIEGPLGGKTVADVMNEYRFGVVQRKSKAGSPELFPPPATLLEDGDELLVQGPFAALVELRRKSLAPM